MKEQKKLIIVDISSFIFRAFFAVRPLHTPDGTPVNAVHGVLSMLLKLLSDHRPTHIFLARDTKEKSFRHELYPEYKANRSAPPEELVPQFSIIEELMEKMKIPNLAVPGFEADDIIGSAAVQWKDEFDEIIIASGDKDLMQFVNEKITMLDSMKNKFYGPKEVFEKMGVRPDQIVDYLSILGDTSDNIPGMKGIGAKGASKMLGEYETLDNCIANKEKFTNKRVVNAFENHLQDALMSKTLIEIKVDVDLGHSPNELQYFFNPENTLYDFLESLGFKSTITKLKKLVQDTQIAESQSEEGVFVHIEDQVEVKRYNYNVVENKKTSEQLIKDIKNSPMIGVHHQFDDGGIIGKELIGSAITLNGHDVYYFPFQHVYEAELGGEEIKNLDESFAEKLFDSIYNREDIEVYSYSCQKELNYLKEKNYNCQNGFFDVGLCAFILDQNSRSTIKYLGEKYLELVISDKDKKEKFSEMSKGRASEFAGDRVGVIFNLAEKFKLELEKKGLEKIYYELDLPLAPVLSKMERKGISVNIGFFHELEEEFSKELEIIEKEIHEISGTEANLKSPKQVGEMLFEKMGLPALKKTKTGFSTDSSVLEELAAQNISEVPALLLRFRGLEKLLSTYVKVLPKLVDPKSGRIHTYLNQNVAATGRLSSDNPNLQNIPVRTKEGRLVRKGFVAEKGKLLFSADYSQVELRILAHLSEDDTLVKAFKDGKDIHAQTAAEVTGIALKDVTSEERSKAKAVNFGLMYGQSSFGLAKSLGITRREAKDYISMYFERFGKIKAFLDSLKEKCEETGYSETMFGRKRFLPDIYSKNRTIKSMAERVSVNSPIQGTAADIIKMAMLKIDSILKTENIKADMLLQVHDELIFEVEEKDLEKLKKIVIHEMENIVKLSVPLKVDTGFGVNWYDLK